MVHILFPRLNRITFGLIKCPILTEKSLGLIRTKQYSFSVVRNADKASIKYVVENLFGVRVIRVNTLIPPRNLQRSRSSRTRPGYSTCYKKAIVKLDKTESIELF